MAADGYAIRETRTDELSTLLTFLEQHFFNREYVNMIYLRRNEHRIDEKEKKMIAQDIKNKYTVAVENLPGLVVVHEKSKEIVGMNLILVEENPKFAEVMSANEIYAEKLRSVPWRSKHLNELATYVLMPANNSVDIFSEFPLHRTALKLLFLCVNPEHCGRSLATRLVRESVRYAESKSIEVVYGLFMSQFSQKAARKNGFEIIRDLDILSFRDKDGNAFFQDEESYIISVMAKQTKSDKVSQSIF